MVVFRMVSNIYGSFREANNRSTDSETTNKNTEMGNASLAINKFLFVLLTNKLLERASQAIFINYFRYKFVGKYVSKHVPMYHLTKTRNKRIRI